MPKIPEETKEEIDKLYKDGLKLPAIARRTGASVSYVYGITLLGKRDNPETGMPFESLKEYHEHLARKRDNPETGMPFESLAEYRDYNEKMRMGNQRNKWLGEMITAGLNQGGYCQSWLAEQIGVSRQAVSLYVSGKSFPKEETLGRLVEVLELGIEYDSLEEAVG